MEEKKKMKKQLFFLICKFLLSLSFFKSFPITQQSTWPYRLTENRYYTTNQSKNTIRVPFCTNQLCSFNFTFLFTNRIQKKISLNKPCLSPMAKKKKRQSTETMLKCCCLQVIAAWLNVKQWNKPRCNFIYGISMTYTVQRLFSWYNMNWLNQSTTGDTKCVNCQERSVNHHHYRRRCH